MGFIKNGEIIDGESGERIDNRDWSGNGQRKKKGPPKGSKRGPMSEEHKRRIGESKRKVPLDVVRARREAGMPVGEVAAEFHVTHAAISMSERRLGYEPRKRGWTKGRRRGPQTPQQIKSRVEKKTRDYTK